ncbi:MAG: Gfo/Idh/MocA family oxidoreductase [Armatimonadota bacterium]|nr:Gfo/Idh/MocA family oxidoreductase [Armatimonadota bacterium]
MIRFGIVGAGTMGGRYAQLLTHVHFKHRCELVAICDTDMTRAQAVAGPRGLPAYASMTEMIQASKLDAVYIAVPDPLHRAPVVEAAAASLHMLVEKPFATTVDDAVAMAEAVKRAGVKAEVNFSNRWNPPFVAARKTITEGGIGEVLTMSSRLNNTISSPTRRLAWAGQSTSGWYLLSHTIDLAGWLSGKTAKAVYASGLKKKLASLGVPTYDYIHAVVKYLDGSDAVFESAWVLPEGMPSAVDFKYQIIGTDGAIFIDTQDQMVHYAAPDRYNYVPTLAWAIERLDAFLKTLEQDKAPDVSVDDGVENTRVLVALHRSLETGSIEPTV